MLYSVRNLLVGIKDDELIGPFQNSPLCLQQRCCCAHEEALGGSLRECLVQEASTITWFPENADNHRGCTEQDNKKM